METMKKLLQEHFDTHPDLEIQDAVKFLYQSHMGPGHLIQNETEAYSRLNKEWDQVTADSLAAASTSLGGGYCRLHLAACKGLGLSPKTLFRLFLLTAQQAQPDRSSLEHDLDLIYLLPFPREEVSHWLQDYCCQGFPAVSHSSKYRSAYSPSYRVVFSRLARLLPLLSMIDQKLEDKLPVMLAIDGPCASGKSTLGDDLAQIYGCPLIHMDDFFLRPEQRTETRLAQPGGNIDYERFLQEVLLPLTRHERACYSPWHCQSGTFAPPVCVTPSPLIVVEGSYSLCPNLRNYYNLRIWIEAPFEVRLRRLAQRGGPDILERFRTLWIPLENQYFQVCQVKQCCHLHLSGVQK